jgi:hypothetical protein
MSKFNEELIEELTELNTLIPVPVKAFKIAALAKEDDYEAISITDAVDLIIAQSHIKE